MSSHGFQQNATILSSLWRYFPDSPTGRIIIVDLSKVQFIEASADGSKVWLYCAANNVSTSQAPYVLEGQVAQDFMADIGALFS